MRTISVLGVFLILGKLLDFRPPVDQAADIQDFMLFAMVFALAIVSDIREVKNG